MKKAKDAKVLMDENTRDFMEDPAEGTGRFDYVKYDEEAVKAQDEMKQMCLHMERQIKKLQPGRARALAIAKLEETYMWYGKGVRDDQIARNGSAPLQEERKDG